MSHAIAIGEAVLLALVLVWVLARARRGRRPVDSSAPLETVADVLPADDAEVVELGGIAYRVIGAHGSVDRDDYMTEIFRRIGLFPLPDMLENETPGEYGLRLLDQLRHDKGPVLAGLLIPASCTYDTDWTRELAAASARHITRRCTSPDDRAKITNLTLSVMLDFFESGIGSSLVSLSSSTTEMQTQRRDPATSDGGNGTALFAS